MSRRVVCPLPLWSADKKCRNHPWHAHCLGYECIYRKQNFDIPTEFISTTLWDCINISMGPNLAQSMFCHVVDRFGLFHWSSENKQFWVETGDHRESLLITLQVWLGREMIAVCVSQGTKCGQSSGHLQGYLKRISELFLTRDTSYLKIKDEQSQILNVQ